jgi:hypothetical protein
LFVNPPKILGWGGSLDFSLRADGQDGSFFHAAVEDLAPPITLKSVLRHERNANTNNVSFDADGYIQFAPLISGRYADQRVRLRLPPTLHTQVGRRLTPSITGIAGWQSTKSIDQFSLGLQWNLQNHQFTSTVFTGSNMPASVELRWQNSHFHLAWRADALSPSKARVWGIHGGTRW